MDPKESCHKKLLCGDLQALTVRPTQPPTFLFRHSAAPVARVETLGVVVSRDRKDKYLKFLVDDGTGVVPCVLWLNHNDLRDRGRPVPRFAARLRPSDLELMAEMATGDADAVRLGCLVRVRGHVSVYLGHVQVTVRDVFEERDPNAQILHWLDCVRLATCFYDSPQSRRAT